MAQLILRECNRYIMKLFLNKRKEKQKLNEMQKEIKITRNA